MHGSDLGFERSGLAVWLVVIKGMGSERAWVGNVKLFMNPEP